MKFDVKANFQIRVGKKRHSFEVGEVEVADKEVIEKLQKSKYATEKKAAAK